MDLKTYLERLKEILQIRVLLKEITQDIADDVLKEEETRWMLRLPNRADPTKFELKPTDRFFTRIDNLPDWLQESMVDISEENKPWETTDKELRSELNVRLGLGLNEDERKYKSLDEMETLYKEQQKTGAEVTAKSERTAKAAAAKIAVKQQDYWDTVMPMLNARISSGQIPYGDVQKLIKDTNELIALGVEPTALTEYKQAQVYQKQIQGEADVMQTGVLSREEQLGQKLQGFLTSGQTDVAMRQMEKSRQITRQPRNWIEYWQMQHGVNPDEQPLSKAQKWENYLGQQNETLQNLEAWSDFLDKNPPAVKGSSYYDLAQGIPAMIQAQRELVGQITQSEIPPASETSFHQAQPLSTPMAESWLERLVPGQKAGQPLTKPSNVPIPSGQQWQNLLPSEQEKFAGYLDWANVDVEDILFQMKRSLPETPRGAGRWNPVGQRSG